MSSSALRNFNYIALNWCKSLSAILFPLINSPGQVKFSICNSNWPQCKRRQREREGEGGREGGRVVRRCLSSISTSCVGETERGRVQSMHFMLITMPFHGEQMGSFACIFQIILQFIWINSLKGSTMQSGLSSKRCGMLASHTEMKHYFFNLFISCHSTFCKQQKLFTRFTVLIWKQAIPLSKRWRRKCSILMTTETEWPRGTLTHQRFF